MSNCQNYNSDDIDSEHESYSIKIFNELIWIKISSFFYKKSRVLDLGCGNGRHSKFFSPHVSSVLAVDGWREVNHSLIKECNNIEFKKTDFMNLVDDKFDIIFTHGVFHQIFRDYKESGFDKIISLLNDNGVFINLEGDWKNPSWEAGYRYNLDSLLEKNKHNLIVLSSDIIDEWGAIGGRLTIIKKEL